MANLNPTEMPKEIKATKDEITALFYSIVRQSQKKGQHRE